MATTTAKAMATVTVTVSDSCGDRDGDSDDDDDDDRDNEASLGPRVPRADLRQTPSQASAQTMCLNAGEYRHALGC